MKLLAGLIVGAIVYRFLMWDEALGLNAFIFAVLITGAVFAYREELRHQKLLWMLAGAFIVSAAGVVVTGILFSHIIYYLTLIVFLAFVQVPALRSPWVALVLFPYHSAIAIWKDFNMVGNALSELFDRRTHKPRRIPVKWWQVVIIGTAAMVFVGLFSMASPAFADIISRFWHACCDALQWIIPDLSFLEIIHFLFVIYFLSLFFIRFKHNLIIDEDLRASDILLRIRSRQYTPFLRTGLKSEYQAAVAGMIVIGALLLTLNILDIRSVWVAIAPDSAPELSHFVHQGTYALIASVILSISLLLFCFRKNLNFYPRNTLLKAIACSWVGQNIFLIVSTALRNWHYVSEYGLTYRRIGVFIFLLMTGAALLLMLLKIQRRTTLYHFFRMSLFSSLGLLALAALINWDVLIASYNTTCIEKEPDYAYLRLLSCQAAPYIPASPDEIDKTASPDATDEWDETDETDEWDEWDETSHYRYLAKVRKYIERVDSRGWKSYNFGDDVAVGKLKQRLNSTH
ncbi:MAG: DUF4173 domain-containing protein [Prevotellaceae bacterium]|nr:DUF4173 domain-containing protein [Prevotellaceae bacterium]